MQKLTPDETLLGLLAAQARHGYQLLDCFRDPAQLGHVWNLSTSQLYAVLKRLEQQGLIAGQQVQPDDAPTRTVYRLTGAGHVRLDAWLDDLEPSPSVRRVRVEFLSRLYIAGVLGRPAGAIIERQRQACQAQRARLAARREQLPSGIGGLALDFMIGQLDAVLVWIEQCETTLRDES